MPFFRLALLLVTTCSITKAQDLDPFAPITGSVPQDITGIVLPPFCDAQSKVVKILTTLEPTDGDVAILTSPPNLVTVDTKAGFMEGAVWLGFILNQTVATAATEAGIIIQMPPSQLERVDVCCAGQIQILQGFNNVKSLLASTSASIHAILSPASNATSTTQDLDLAVSTSGRIAVDYWGGTVNIVSASTSGVVDLVADTVTEVIVSTSGVTNLQLMTAPNHGTVSTSGVVQVSLTDGCGYIEASTSGTCTTKGDLAVNFVVGDTFTESGQESCAVSSETIITDESQGASPMALAVAASTTVLSAFIGW